MRFWGIAVGTTLALLLAGCRTASFSEGVPPVTVPSGLTQEDVAAAILVVLTGGASLDQPPGLVTSAKRALAAHATYLEQRSGAPTQQVRRVTNWYLEDFGPGRVVAGVQRAAHAMSLELSFDAQEIQIRPIRATPGIRWKGDTVHSNVIRWVTELTSAIRYELGAMKRFKSQPVEVPTDAEPAPAQQ